MAFIVESGSVISFAEFSDLTKRDQRLLDNNESLTDDFCEDTLIRSTTRILERIRGTDWWRTLYRKRNTGVNPKDIPAPNADLIVGRTEDFTDLCVYVALSEYILPAVADFGAADSSERQKMGYYENRATQLFGELITYGDWYDWNDDGSVETNEKEFGQFALKRIR